MRTPSAGRWAALTRLRNDLGANLIETALLILMIALVALAAVGYFGSNTRALWDEVPASFETGG